MSSDSRPFLGHVLGQSNRLIGYRLPAAVIAVGLAGLTAASVFPAVVGPHACSLALACLAVVILGLAFAARAWRLQSDRAWALLGNVFDSFPTGITIKDADLRYVWVNRDHVSRLGRTFDVLRGKRPDEIGVDTALAVSVMAHDRQVLDSGRAQGPSEQTVPRPDGSHGHALVVKVPLVIDGAVSHIVSAGTDISAIHEARAEAAAARNLLESIIDNAPVTIQVKTADLRYQRINRAFAELLSRSPDELVGKSAQDLKLDPAMVELAERLDRQVLLTGEAIGPYEHDIPNARGEIRHMLGIKVPLRDAGGAVNQVMTFGLDITGRKRAEADLHRLNQELERRVAERTEDVARSSDLLARVIDRAPIGIVTFDLQGRITTWNPEAERIMGYAAHEVVGKPPPRERLTDPRAEAQFAEMSRRIRLGESYSGLEATRRRKDGTMAELIVGGAPLFDRAGQVNGAIGIWLDVTAQRATERQLQQAQKMEAVGQLTGGIAHDFNNLLSVVIGNLDLGLDAKDLDYATRQMRKAMNAAQRSAELTRRLLGFSRQQMQQPTKVDPGAVIAGIKDMVSRGLGSRVEIQLDLPPMLWQVHVDLPQFETALLNLCVNGRDAMEDGDGRLTIRAANARLRAGDAGLSPGLSPGDYVRIAVADSGGGMPPEVLARAFEPFFTTKPTGKGTGLGLSMVYAFVRQSGGHASIDSQVGQGTTVTLLLPRSRGPAGDPIADAPARDLHGHETILVVEDDESISSYVREQLGALGYTTIAAPNGDAAAEMLRAGTAIDLLFSDIMMPGRLNGRALAALALQLRPTLPILLTSGYEQPSLATDTAVGALRVLAKPYRREQLARAVRDALDAAART